LIKQIAGISLPALGFVIVFRDPPICGNGHPSDRYRNRYLNTLEFATDFRIRHD